MHRTCLIPSPFNIRTVLGTVHIVLEFDRGKTGNNLATEKKLSKAAVEGPAATLSQYDLP